MNDDESFFLNCLDDLRGKVDSGKEYEVLRATGILRQLLLDSPAIAHVANKRARVPLIFCTSPPDITSRANAGTLLLVETTDPRVMNPATLKEMKLDQYLGMTLAVSFDREIKVRELISTCANCLGGVHRAPPKSEEQHAVAGLLKGFEIDGVTGVVIIATGVVATCIAALEHIEEAIKRGI